MKTLFLALGISLFVLGCGKIDDWGPLPPPPGPWDPGQPVLRSATLLNGDYVLVMGSPRVDRWPMKRLSIDAYGGTIVLRHQPYEVKRKTCLERTENDPITSGSFGYCQE